MTYPATPCGHAPPCRPEGPCFWKEDRMTFTTKDSGKRETYASGMVRDTQEGKPRFSLLLPKGVPYAGQMLTRFAELMARGADKYGDRNWELARGEEELDRYHDSAFRHFMQWVTGETDEDHAAAVLFNIVAAETVKYKMRQPQGPVTFYTQAGILEAYCVKCKAKREMTETEAIQMKNGKPAAQGVCGICRTKMFKIGVILGPTNQWDPC